VISRNEVMPLLLEAAPSYAERWAKLEHEAVHIDEESGGRLHYLDAGEFARHLVALHQRGARDELRRSFDVIERLHTDGDDYVRELATIGFLEDLQTACTQVDGVAATEFEGYLGPESRKWWAGLNRFWSGEATSVRAVDEAPDPPRRRFPRFRR